jgi:carbon monoxide dehydrogenase subunit G
MLEVTVTPGIAAKGESAMGQFSVSTFINRSQQDVFDFLSDPAIKHKWMPMVKSAAWTSSGEPGVGSTVEAIVEMAGKETEMQFEITQWDLPNRYDYKILTVMFPMKAMAHSFRLEPEDGGTRVSQVGEFEMVSVLRFAAGLMGKYASRMNQNELNTLKQLLEAG